MIRRLLIPLLILSFSVHLCFSQEASNDEKLAGYNITERAGRSNNRQSRDQAIDRLSRNFSIRSVKNKSVKIVLSPLTVEWFISESMIIRLSK